jgi:peptide chain release factor 2
MLARMYVRWAEKSGYSVEMQSETPGEEAGIKSVTYKISGHNALWLVKIRKWCASLGAYFAL